jgi:hypothetical protein
MDMVVLCCRCVNDPISLIYVLSCLAESAIIGILVLNVVQSAYAIRYPRKSSAPTRTHMKTPQPTPQSTPTQRRIFASPSKARFSPTTLLRTPHVQSRRALHSRKSPLRPHTPLRLSQRRAERSPTRSPPSSPRPRPSMPRSHLMLPSPFRPHRRPVPPHLGASLARSRHIVGVMLLPLDVSYIY